MAPSKAEEVRLEQGEAAPGWSDGGGREAGTEMWIREAKFSSRVISWVSSWQGGQR